ELDRRRRGMIDEPGDSPRLGPELLPAMAHLDRRLDAISLAMDGPEVRLVPKHATRPQVLLRVARRAVLVRKPVEEDFVKVGANIGGAVGSLVETDRRGGDCADDVDDLLPGLARVGRAP